VHTGFKGSKLASIRGRWTESLTGGGGEDKRGGRQEEEGGKKRKAGEAGRTWRGSGTVSEVAMAFHSQTVSRASHTRVEP